MKKIEPLNTIPIQAFISQVKSADSSRSKEVTLTIEQAKTLAFTLGIVMSRLEGDLEKLVAAVVAESAIEIKVDGGGLGF
jgi:hypothetical protein